MSYDQLLLAMYSITSPSNYSFQLQKMNYAIGQDFFISDLRTGSSNLDSFIKMTCLVILVIYPTLPW